MKKSQIILVMLSSSLVLVANSVCSQNKNEINVNNSENTSIVNKNDNENIDTNTSNLSNILNKSKILVECIKSNNSTSHNNASNKFKFDDLKKNKENAKTNTSVFENWNVINNNISNPNNYQVKKGVLNILGEKISNFYNRLF